VNLCKLFICDFISCRIFYLSFVYNCIFFGYPFIKRSKVGITSDTNLATI